MTTLKNPKCVSMVPLSRISRRGFTIIELLVVVAIIALLASTVVALFSNARSRSRDAKRVGDIKELHDALAVYVTNTRTFPNPTIAGGICLTGSDAISTTLVGADAIKSIPRDPQQNCGSGLPTAANPHYHYESLDGSTYTLWYYLETDSIPGKNPGQQPPVSP
jgi:prepilin-type N-terminal cleavage/methylation domain-containing protein